MTTTKVRIIDISVTEKPVNLRLPFRYGANTLTKARQAFVTVRIRGGGREATGCAAELLAPKWFDKSPALSDDDNVAQLRQALSMVRQRYLDTSEPLTAFDLHALHDAGHMAESARQGCNGLVAGYGMALIDKAVIAALCRLEEKSFFNLVRENRVGLTSATAPDLDGTDLTRFLCSLAPKNKIFARHTIGAIDALTEAEVAEDARLNDGLPESLEAAIDRYGLKAFKVKLTGRLDFDLARLRNIAKVLDHKVGRYIVTLDGNEQFTDTQDFAEFWKLISAHPDLRRLGAAIEFVEQPIARELALDRHLNDLAHLVAVEIDESDDSVSAFPRAVELGYRGISSKSCKGVYRSLLNRARVAILNTSGNLAGKDYFMSAEDLCAQAGLAVQQDLSLASIIGCKTTERNGHHFGDGQALEPGQAYEAWQARYVGLYQSFPDRLCLRIENGLINTGSLAGSDAYG